MRNRIMFLLSIFMLLVCIGTVMAGVYSPFFANGSVFMFFIALFNVYIYILIYLNSPVEID